MNQEIIEKMQYLYSCGFVPDVWVVGEDTPVSIITITKCREGMTYSLGKAYFTESRLWSLLPNVIRGFALAQGKDLPGVYSIGYFWQLGSSINADDSLITFIGDDTHINALDLTIWAVKNGYLRSDNKEKIND